ncbi:MAG: UDP-N-acetylglucosamine 2-epimerase (non-hydrolyzing) [Alphaproteobacteria bacterium]|nr:UDP-N-acetylglucosamine 2-epimerase (non-hydrolyzing) [Alphaproteobacteria bacterium]
MKILSIIGARPQFIKAATVSRTIGNHSEINEIILHTGQHYDENMSEVFFRELDIPRPDYNLGVGSGSHAEQTGSMLIGIEEILLLEKPDLVLVYGDTNSTIAGALAAVKLHIRVAHVEAGLRSFNRFMPEEINRIVTDRISDLLFAPTLTAMNNLQKEGLAEITKFSGDVMYDSVLFYIDRIKRNPEQYITPGIPDKYHLATIHRAENTDNPQNLKDIFTAFGNIEKNIVLPLHPRTRKTLLVPGNIPANMTIIDPVGYLQMLYLTLHADKVLTDSGGLQKEAYFLGKQCITLRTETEWVETMHDNWNIITGSDPGKIVRAILADPPKAPVNKDFGDGNAAGVILESLLRF